MNLRGVLNTRGSAFYSKQVTDVFIPFPKCEWCHFRCSAGRLHLALEPITAFFFFFVFTDLSVLRNKAGHLTKSFIYFPLISFFASSAKLYQCPWASWAKEGVCHAWAFVSLRRFLVLFFAVLVRFSVSSRTNLSALFLNAPLLLGTILPRWRKVYLLKRPRWLLR